MRFVFRIDVRACTWVLMTVFLLYRLLRLDDENSPRDDASLSYEDGKYVYQRARLVWHFVLTFCLTFSSMTIL